MIVDEEEDVIAGEDNDVGEDAICLKGEIECIRHIDCQITLWISRRCVLRVIFNLFVESEINNVSTCKLGLTGRTMSCLM